MSYDTSNFSLNVSRIKKPFTSFPIKDASSSLFNRSTDKNDLDIYIRGNSVAYNPITGRYVLCIRNQSQYDTQNGIFLKQTLYYSDNGKDWINCLTPILNVTANSVIWCGFLNKFFACGYGRNGEIRTQIASSSDGITWQSSLFTNVSVSFYYKELACSNNKIVAVSEIFTDTSLYSVDGINWLPINGLNINNYPTRISAPFSVAWSQQQNLWVAVGGTGLNVLGDSQQLGYFAWSVDGITWTQGACSDNTVTLMTTVRYDSTNQLWVACGNNSQISNLLVSTDGKNWTNRSNILRNDVSVGINNNGEWLLTGGFFTPIIINDVLQFVGPTVSKSTDQGNTWINIQTFEQNLSTMYGPVFILWAGNKWILAGYSFTGANPTLTEFIDTNGVIDTHDKGDQNGHTSNYLYLEKTIQLYENS